MSVLTSHSVEVFDIRKFGALSSPNDIGPAVQAAGNAAIADGGGVIYIPPRADALQWGWTTFADINCNNDKSITVCGMRGRTIIQAPLAGVSLLQVGNSNAMIVIEDLIFTGNPAPGVNVPNVVSISQARTGILRDCQFLGLSCNATNYGIARIVADTTLVEGCLFKGCDYAGTALQGGVLSISGLRDSCVVKGCRFQIGEAVIAGVALTSKSGSSGNMWLWLANQGLDGAVTAYGGVKVEQCYFESSVPAGCIGILPTGSFVIDHGQVTGCAFNPGSGNPCIVADFCRNLEVDNCDFANSPAGDVVIKVGDCDRFIARLLKFKTGGKKIQWTSPAPTYVEINECEGYTLDTSLATPSFGIEKVNGFTSVIYP